MLDDNRLVACGIPSIGSTQPQSPRLPDLLIATGWAILDNITPLYAVLTTQPDMSFVQWLTITSTESVGGSPLSIGSAAITPMAQARGVHNFSTQLRCMPAASAGYFDSIFTHLALNAHAFDLSVPVR